MVFSLDGGRTWAAPVHIPSTAQDVNHVHPAITLDDDAENAHVTYYVQQANEQLRTDIATVRLDGRRARLAFTAGLSDVAFDLTPSNIPRPTPTNPFETTNYDRAIAHCYDIGEYMSVASNGDDDDGPVAAWGDNRNSWTGPTGSAAPFTHAQPDVFFEHGF